MLQSNVDKDDMLLNMSHSNHGKSLKDSPDSFLGTNMVSESNVDSNNIQNENTETESARDERTVVTVNETFITDNRTARKKKKIKYAQALIENVEKTADQNVSCLKEELQLGNCEKTF